MTRDGSQRHRKKIYIYLCIYTIFLLKAAQDVVRHAVKTRYTKAFFTSTTIFLKHVCKRTFIYVYKTWS